MPLIVAHTAHEYVTLINHFTVDPKDGIGMARVQCGDMYWYGRQQPGALSASFHLSLDRQRFFNYGQWTSVDELKRSHASPDFKLHLGNYRFFAIKADPHVYEATWTTRDTPVAIRWPSPVVPVFDVAVLKLSDLERYVARQREMLQSLGEGDARSGFVAAALHVSLAHVTADAARSGSEAAAPGAGKHVPEWSTQPDATAQVAVYSQWQSERAWRAAIEGTHQAIDTDLSQRVLRRDARAYELWGTTDD